jgi:4-amino-4-deoxy-L-arabinose transferase-like glycosyltransferase
VQTTTSPNRPAQAIAAERYLSRRAGIVLAVVLAILTGYRILVLHFANIDLYVDEAQYWTWAQHLDWGYYSKPPVIAAVIAATTAVLGDSELGVKAGSLLIYPIVAWLLFALVRRLFDTRTAFWAAFIFVTLPGAAFSVMIISTDVPMFLCWACALFAYLRAVDDDRWHWWLLLGAAVGAGLMTKYTMVIFGLSVLLHLGFSRELRHHFRNPKLYAAMALALAIFAPNIIWNAQHDWPTLKHTGDISGLEQKHGPLLHWHEFIAFLGGQAALVGPIYLIAWVLQLVFGAREWSKDPRYRMLAWFSLPFLALISVLALLGRANANWAAMVYVAATIFFVARLIEKRHWGWLVIGLLFNLAVTELAYHYDYFAHVAGISLNRHTDVYKRVRGWHQIGQQATALQQRYPQTLFLADDRDILAELEYYVHPHPLDAVEWNPDHRIDSHYALTTTMADKIGRDFLYVTRSASLPDDVRASFASAQPLQPLQVEIHPDYHLDFHVWLLKGFRGYP